MFKPCSSVSIVNIEHVSAGWVRDVMEDFDGDGEEVYPLL